MRALMPGGKNVPMWVKGNAYQPDNACDDLSSSGPVSIAAIEPPQRMPSR